MKLFLSWSKPNSRALAAFLKKWLPDVLPGIEPWMSAEDIEKGVPWFDAIQGALVATHSCIICVTPENVDSKWLYYEAGAISGKGGSKIRIQTLLVDVQANSLS